MSKPTIIYGYHALSTLLKNHPEAIEQLCVLNSRKDKRIAEIQRLASQHNISIQQLSRDELDKLCNGATHQGMLARCMELPSYSEKDLDGLLEADGPVLFLILDGVQDPHNLGACMRSANAMGVTAVIAPKDRSVSMTPAVRKVACGADMLTPFIQVTNLSRTMRAMQDKNIWIVGAAMDAEQKLEDIDMRGNIAIVMGGEGSGLRDLTRKHCDYVARIPMYGSVESLNVSVSTGICLYEVVRQRDHPAS